MQRTIDSHDDRIFYRGRFDAPVDDDEARSLVVTALHAGAPTIVVQPILGLGVGRTVAYEALSRFTHGGPSLSPDQWFAMAHRWASEPYLRHAPSTSPSERAQIAPRAPCSPSTSARPC